MKIFDQITLSYMTDFFAALSLLSAAAILKFVGKITSIVPRKLFMNMIFIPFFCVGYLFVFSLLLRMQMTQVQSMGSLITAAAIFIFILLQHGSVMVKNFREENVRQRIIEERMRTSSLVDEATGLYNRKGFVVLIKHYLLLAKRNKDHVLFFYLTVNNLKQITDTKGEQESELIVHETSKLLKSTFRKSDIIARVDTDTFMVLLIAATATHEDAVTSNFKKNLDNHNSNKRGIHELQLSYCAMPFDPVWQDEIDTILLQAQSLMSAKKNGKKLAAMSV